MVRVTTSIEFRRWSAGVQHVADLDFTCWRCSCSSNPSLIERCTPARTRRDLRALVPADVARTDEAQGGYARGRSRAFPRRRCSVARNADGRVTLPGWFRLVEAG